MDGTTNLNLQKYNLSTELSTPFSIDDALNQNWNTLDSKVGWRPANSSVGSSLQPVYVTSSGQFSTIPYNLPSQSPITATTSLSENGYIKFSSLVCFCLTFLNISLKVLSLLTFDNAKFEMSRVKKSTKLLYSPLKLELI